MLLSGSRRAVCCGLPDTLVVLNGCLPAKAASEGRAVARDAFGAFSNPKPQKSTGLFPAKIVPEDSQ
jgi:hypothetical protein